MNNVEDVYPIMTNNEACYEMLYICLFYACLYIISFLINETSKSIRR